MSTSEMPKPYQRAQALYADEVDCFTADQMREYASACADEALERAVQSCEDEARAAQSMHNLEAEYGADMCAVAVRALKQEKSNGL